MLYNGVLAITLAAGAAFAQSPPLYPGCFDQACCDSQYNACAVAPNANQAYCASQKAACYGALGLPNPFVPSNSSSLTAAPTFTGPGNGTGLPTVTTYVSYCPVTSTPIISGTPCPTTWYSTSLVTETCPCQPKPTGPPVYTTYCPVTTTYPSGPSTITTTYSATVTVTHVPAVTTGPAGPVTNYVPSTIYPSQPPAGVTGYNPPAPNAPAPAPNAPAPAPPMYTGAAAIASPAAGLIAAALFAMI